MTTTPNTPEQKLWKHIGILTLWLYFILPVGLWKLWEDKILRPAAKWRLLIYLVVLPSLIYMTFSFWMASKRLMPLLP